jgi:hypothetical protein
MRETATHMNTPTPTPTLEAMHNQFKTSRGQNVRAGVCPVPSLHRLAERADILRIDFRAAS